MERKLLPEYVIIFQHSSSTISGESLKQTLVLFDAFMRTGE